jgi:hypothetical protein
MNARIFKINRKTKIHPLGIADRTDFTCDEGEEIPIETLLKNPNMSLYCLDPEDRRVIFVETSDRSTLSDFPFYYIAQYEQAIRIATLEFETLHEISDRIPLNDQNLIFLYSVGRCGSTLISSAFNCVNHVTVLSEPDVYSQLVRQRQWDGK